MDGPMDQKLGDLSPRSPWWLRLCPWTTQNHQNAADVTKAFGKLRMVPVRHRGEWPSCTESNLLVPRANAAWMPNEHLRSYIGQAIAADELVIPTSTKLVAGKHSFSSTETHDFCSRRAGKCSEKCFVDTDTTIGTSVCCRDPI
jgi:hypothetical protein